MFPRVWQVLDVSIALQLVARVSRAISQSEFSYAAEPGGISHSCAGIKCTFISILSCIACHAGLLFPGAAVQGFLPLHLSPTRLPESLTVLACPYHFLCPLVLRCGRLLLLLRYF